MYTPILRGRNKGGGEGGGIHREMGGGAYQQATVLKKRLGKIIKKKTFNQEKGARFLHKKEPPE